MPNIATITRGASAVARRPAPVAAGAMRTVGVSRISVAEAKDAAEAVIKLPPAQKKRFGELLTKRNVIIGGVAVGGGIVGMSVDELADLISSANQSELLDFLAVADQVSPAAGDSIAKAHDAVVRFKDLDQDFSAERAADFAVTPVSAGQLSWTREQIEEQQQWSYAYGLVRQLMSYEHLEAFLKIAFGTTPENRAMLEDMRVAGRRGGF